MIYLTIYFFIDRKEGITGKEVTPFILQRVNERTAGKSLEASILFVLLTLYSIDTHFNA